MVPKPVTYVTSKDVISVTADGFSNDKILQSDSENQSTDTASEGTAEFYESIVIEFTDEGTAKFTELWMSLLESVTKSMESQQESGTPLTPSRLSVNITGAESLRFDVIGLQIVRLEEKNSNKFVFALPSSDNQGTSTISIEEARSKLGKTPTVDFQLSEGYIDEDIGLSGDDLESAYPSQHQSSGVPIVNIEFNERGSKEFGRLTTDIYAKQQSTGVRDQIAIILDGKELIAPVVNSPITQGTAIIQGPDFTIERVKDLALLLESGRLPVPIQLIQERDVDAMLGADSLRKSVVAGITGLCLVLLFMILYYRLPGLMASFSLLIYAVIVLAIFKLIPVTLTLSGVAAAILSIGMAVDANILIFERMKDELRSGRTMLSSVNIGFNRAWPAIRDGNVSTLITCAILYWFSDQLGATIVQGFAITLAIGVMISMFTAITITRTFMRVVAISPASKKMRLFIPKDSKTTVDGSN